MAMEKTMRIVKDGGASCLGLTVTGRRRGILEGDGGLDGQSSHVGGGEAITKLGSRKDEVDLIRLELEIPVQGRYKLVVVQTIRIAQEELGTRLGSLGVKRKQDLRDGHRKSKSKQISILRYHNRLRIRTFRFTRPPCLRCC